MEIFEYIVFGNRFALHCGRRLIRMLYWAFMFLVIAIIAAIFGFGIAASAAAAIGKIMFMLFLIGFIVSLVMHVGRRV